MNPALAAIAVTCTSHRSEPTGRQHGTVVRRRRTYSVPAISGHGVSVRNPQSRIRVSPKTIFVIQRAKNLNIGGTRRGAKNYEFSHTRLRRSDARGEIRKTFDPDLDVQHVVAPRSRCIERKRRMHSDAGD